MLPRMIRIVDEAHKIFGSRKGSITVSSPNKGIVQLYSEINNKDIGTDLKIRIETIQPCDPFRSITIPRSMFLSLARSINKDTKLEREGTLIPFLIVGDLSFGGISIVDDLINDELRSFESVKDYNASWILPMRMISKEYDPTRDNLGFIHIAKSKEYLAFDTDGHYLNVYRTSLDRSVSIDRLTVKTIGTILYSLRKELSKYTCSRTIKIDQNRILLNVTIPSLGTIIDASFTMSHDRGKSLAPGILHIYAEKEKARLGGSCFEIDLKEMERSLSFLKDGDRDKNRMLRIEIRGERLTMERKHSSCIVKFSTHVKRLNSKDLTIGLNHSYLSRLVSSIREQVRTDRIVLFLREMESCWIMDSEESISCVIMPVRI